MFTRSSLALVTLGLMITACGPVNRGVESANQPVVQRQDLVFDVQSGPGGLAPGESQRLTDWFASLELGYGDQVAIDGSSAYGYGEAQEAIAAAAARFGLLISDHAPIIGGSAPSGAVRVIISRVRASVPNCPNWRGNAQPNFGNSSMANYGCAVNSNLAAMVANPEDLVRGQTGRGQADPQVSVKAIQTYRDAEPTGKGGLKSEASKGGN